MTTKSTTALDAAELKYPRRSSRKRQTRERILEAAQTLFQAHGYDAVKMTDIADAADVHVTTMFIHFKTKRDLAASISEADTDNLLALIDESQGKVPFFTFCRDVSAGWAKAIQSAGRPGTVFGNDLISDPELSFNWLANHKRGLVAYARYFAADYGWAPHDMLPYLVANMLTGGNAVAYERWLKSAGTSDLLGDCLHAIDLCEAMVEAKYGRPPKA